MEYSLEELKVINNLPIKVELFSGTSTIPYYKSYYNSILQTRTERLGKIYEMVNCIAWDFGAWVDLPATERLVEVLITNKQKSFEKLYLDSNGDILTAIKFTVEEK